MMKTHIIKAMFVAAFGIAGCNLGAQWLKVEEIEPKLPLPNSNWVEIGKIRHKSSSEIKDSKISIGFECLDRDMFEPEKVYDKLAETGIKKARCQTGWGKTEKVKGVYDFKWLDDIVNNLTARGIEPYFNLGFGNAIYMGKTKTPTAVGYVPLYYGEECLNAWKNYVDALSKRYKDKVKIYEIWNEPSHIGFWLPKEPDVREYAKLIRISAEIIRKNVPDAKIGATVAGAGRPFQYEYFKNGGADCIDFFAVHSYCIIPEERHDVEVRVSRDWIERYSKGRKIEIWQTEAGFASYFPKKHFRRTITAGGEYMQAKWMLRRTILDLAAGYGLSSHFQCVDFKKGYQMGQGGAPLFGRYGVFENITYKPKKIFHVFKNLTPILDESAQPRPFFGYVSTLKAVADRLGASRLFDSAKRVETFERNGYPMFAIWLAEDVQTQMAPIANCSFNYVDGPKPLKRPVLLDPISGKIFECKKIVPEKGNVYAYLDGVPLADYPLIITDYDAVRDIIKLNK